MNGTCECCGRQGAVAGTPVTCLGCLDCNPARGHHGDTHGLADDELEAYTEGGYVRWRRRPTVTYADRLEAADAWKRTRDNARHRAAAVPSPPPGCEASVSALTDRGCVGEWARKVDGYAALRIRLYQCQASRAAHIEVPAYYGGPVDLKRQADVRALARMLLAAADWLATQDTGPRRGSRQMGDSAQLSLDIGAADVTTPTHTPDPQREDAAS